MEFDYEVSFQAPGNFTTNSCGVKAVLIRNASRLVSIAVAVRLQHGLGSWSHQYQSPKIMLRLQGLKRV